MTTAIIIVVVIVIIAAIGMVALTTRRRKLKRQFGPEYDRAVEAQNSKLRAEAELTDRQRRVRKLDIRPLDEAARAKYTADWMAIQEHFVDSPREAVAEAYELVTTVMTERGYPTDDDEQVLADLSVEHAQTVGEFRAAQDISRRSAAGQAPTEDLRQAFIHYRALFSDLLGTTGAPPGGTTPAGTSPAGTSEATTTQDTTTQDTAPTSPDGVVVGVPASDIPEDSQR
jgi:FtsZ-interacting cell division protein ZipA